MTKRLRNAILSIATVLGWMLISIPCIAQAPLPDIGMITQLSGTVWVASPDAGQAMEAQNFMKVRGNDHFKVSANAVVQLVYFSNGRKETWKGPAEFIASLAGGNANIEAGSKAPDQVDALPGAVAAEIRRMAALVDPSRVYATGSYQIRGQIPEQTAAAFEALKLTPEETKQIDAAWKICDDLSSRSDSGDITAQLYFFSVLAEFDQFERMRELIADMRKKQPGNRQLDALEDWITDQGDCGPKP